jgi:tRNA uridine 5-carboxymethylaminomethyl modification enzyme
MAVLVDDLVTKGTNEPYRMFTSRAEHRLLLREDNADARLTEMGRALGLVRDDHWQIYAAKQTAITETLSALRTIRIRPDAATRDALAAIGAAAPGKSVMLADVLRQPAVSIDALAVFHEAIADTPADALKEAETIIKYEGYLKRQEQLVERFHHLEDVSLPAELDYTTVAGLTREVVEKLTEIRPLTLGQASRISGITPAAIACLEVHLKKLGL